MCLHVANGEMHEDCIEQVLYDAHGKIIMIFSNIVF